MSAISVLLVDDHKIVRQGLHAILDNDIRFNVIGEAATGQEALHIVEETSPDVVILDLKLTDISGAELCRQIVKLSSKSAVLILTGYFEYDLVCACMQAGARGYLIKDAEQLDLAEQIIHMVQGHAVLDPRAADALTDFVQNQRQGVDLLSARELEIVRLISQGLSNHEIAERLLITENTIKSHIKEIFLKFDVHNRIEAVVVAKKRGILS
jgi:two-component system, NarL family, response regulator DevR